MKKFLFAILAANVFATTAFAGEASTPTPTLTTDQDQLSYVFGLNIGMNFRAQQMGINQAVFLKGLNDGLVGTPPAMAPAQIKAVLMTFQKQMMAKQQAAIKALADKNETAGVAFRKEFAKQKEVVSLHNGEILYKVITAGSGPVPKATDTVTMTYEGHLIDGTTFDSTKAKGDKPISLPLDHMIPGMQEVLLKMPVGSTWQMVLSPKVAYGVMGVPGTPISPNATLIFTINLKASAPTPPPPAK